ncbi:hypothetical protein HY008_02525 [Candidatus Woesebacteria bacterium]|nr:hypothetical protein [Candidatus Woesebacteria bacterium]
MAKQKVQKTITDEEIRKLVIERLKTFPSDKKVSIGADGDFTKDELIRHVDEQDKIGKKIIEIQLAYLQSLKEGIVLDE